MDVLSNNPLFTTFKKSILIKMALKIEKEFFHRNQIVFHEGDKADSIYVIKEGEFQVI